ncbi:unnamed protein product [Closterium sp. NIES-54]
MDVAPHFLWPFAVQYAAHQINLQPRVSLPETTPTLRWTGKVGDASAFCVWGSRAFVRDTTADKLSSRAVPCVFLGFPPDAPGWQFYHPTSRRVLSSQDITFDESVSYYRLFPYRTASPSPPPLFLAPRTPPVHPLPPQGPAPSGVSQVDPAEPVEVAVDSSATRGAEPTGAGTGGAGTGGTAVTDPLFESTAASALSESTSVCPPSVGGECALGMDVLEDRQEEFECFAASVPHLVSMLIAPEGDPDSPDMPTPCSYVEAIEGPYSSQWQAAMDIEMPSWKSTGTYVDEVPPPGANIVSGMWIFRVKWPPGSPPVFKARYVARGFKDLVFATADTEALAHVKSKLQKRHTCTDLGELTSYLGLRITRDRAHRTITLTQSHMVQQVLQRFGFMYSSPQSTPLPTGHSLSAPPSDESVEPSGPYPELVGCLMYLMTCTRPDLAYPLSLLARYVAPDRHQKSTRSSSVLSSSCEAEIYARAMAAQELRWLTYLLTDLGEAPRSPPVLYVDNKAMLALCREHRLEHRTKHIALRYFLARELQQRGQLRLAYVAS